MRKHNGPFFLSFFPYSPAWLLIALRVFGNSARTERKTFEIQKNNFKKKRCALSRLVSYLYMFTHSGNKKGNSPQLIFFISLNFRQFTPVLAFGESTAVVAFASMMMSNYNILSLPLESRLLCRRPRRRRRRQETSGEMSRRIISSLSLSYFYLRRSHQVIER